MASGDGDAPHARREADLHPRWPPPTPTAAAPSPAPVDQTSIGSRGGRRGGSGGACQPGGVGAGSAAGRIRHCRAGRGKQNRQPPQETPLKKKAILIAPPGPGNPFLIRLALSPGWARRIPRPDQETPGGWLVRFLARFLALRQAGGRAGGRGRGASGSRGRNGNGNGRGRGV
jgi:hypothetical protein